MRTSVDWSYSDIAVSSLGSAPKSGDAHWTESPTGRNSLVTRDHAMSEFVLSRSTASHSTRNKQLNQSNAKTEDCIGTDWLEVKCGFAPTKEKQ